MGHRYRSAEYPAELGDGFGQRPLRYRAVGRQRLVAQLNRSDTLRARYSLGLVAFPNLKPLTADRAFHGWLDLYDGVLEEHGAASR